MGKKYIKAVYDKNSTHISVLPNFCLSNCSENFQLIFKLTSADVSWKVFKKLSSKNYAKYWFNYVWTDFSIPQYFLSDIRWEGSNMNVVNTLSHSRCTHVCVKKYRGVGTWGWGVRGHCVLKLGFMRTFPRNQDLTVKLKSRFIFIKFYYFFNVLAGPKPICFTQTIPSTCEP